MEQPKKQVCRITLTFPIDSDDRAIEYKKKIAVIMADLEESQIQFSLMDVSTRPPLGN